MGKLANTAARQDLKHICKSIDINSQLDIFNQLWDLFSGLQARFRWDLGSAGRKEEQEDILASALIKGFSSLQTWLSFSRD